MAQVVDRIGFLNIPASFEFEGGRLTLLPDFAETKRGVDRYTNNDGFVYPPLSYKATINLKTGRKRKVPKTERPKFLHQLPPSHELVINGTTDLIEARKSLAAFVMYCFAFLFGTQLQFHDWWLDGRIPMKPTVNTTPTRAQAEQFISKATRTWNERLDEKSRMLATNVLFMFSRATSPEWDWERFLLEYIVFDASFVLAYEQDARHVSQQKRFKILCEKYGLKKSDELINKLIDLRNNLFHQALWDEGQPTTAQSSSAFFASHHLRRFNHRLIAAILAGPTEYTASPWWSIGQFAFKA